MKIKNSKTDTDVGVIVGRFQVPSLHEAHMDLIRTVIQNHARTIIFLGLSPLKATVQNPLDYRARRQMILNEFPDLDILFIKDTPSDIEWSGNLDYQIEDLIGPNQTVTLYGGRNSFIKHYTGKFNTQELIPETIISGTQIRTEVSNNSKNSEDFRAGVIWATMNQFPTVIPTVDIAIVDRSEPTAKLLLGQKRGEDKLRFIGGFANPNGQGGFEADARREVREETDIEISDLRYIGSYYIDDWRYRGETNKIVTTFFMAEYSFGQAVARDDIHRVQWVNINNLNCDLFVPEHVVLFKAFLDKGIRN